MPPIFFSQRLQRLVWVTAIVWSSSTLIGCSAGAAPPLQSVDTKVKRAVPKLKSLDEKLDKPKPGEWLDRHDEKGQSFAQYIKIRPNVLTPNRSTLYIQPIGKLSEAELKIVEATNEYLGVYFNCPVKMLGEIDDANFPESAKREFPNPGDKQLLTSHILQKQLAPNLPEDAFAILAITNRDLWPGEGWNFVFGYASLRDRVGVWSLHRFGDPSESEAAYKRCLIRTIKLATHETGHMFSMQHCTNARCNMQGSNNLAESDSQPLHLCSQCQGKVNYATGSDPLERLKKLKSLCEKHGFDQEVTFFDSAIQKLDRQRTPSP